MAITTTSENLGSGDLRVIKFAGATTGDTSPVIDLAEWADRSVQVAGTFGGATVTIEGSNDGANWATLNDAQGNALTITTAKIEQLLEVTRHTRVTVTGGTGTSLTITFLLRRAQMLRV